MLNNAAGISSGFNSRVQLLLFFFPLSSSLHPLSLLFSLSPPPSAAVFSTALNPGPGSVSMVTVGSKALAGQSQPGLHGAQHTVWSSLKYLVFSFMEALRSYSFNSSPCLESRWSRAQAVMSPFCLYKCTFVCTCRYVYLRKAAAGLTNESLPVCTEKHISFAPSLPLPNDKSRSLFILEHASTLTFSCCCFFCI